MSVCQTLIQLLMQGFNIAAVTGNDLHQLSARFAKTLVQELCRHKQLQLLARVHLFCNCATVYIAFAPDSVAFAALVARQATLQPEQLQEEALSALFHEVAGLLEIQPEFVVAEYLQRTCMSAADARAAVAGADAHAPMVERRPPAKGRFYW